MSIIPHQVTSQSAGSEQHPCRLVPRFLYPRWDGPRRERGIIEFCRQVGADEMMLFPTGQTVSPGWLDQRELESRSRRIGQIRRQAAAQGVRVVINNINFTDDFGQLAGTPAARSWPWAVDITVRPAVGYRCLLSPRTRAAAIANLTALARSGVSKIFLDDEVRIDWHPAATRPEGAHYCFCPLHLRAFSRRLGRQVNREQLVAALQSARPADRALRRKWLAFKRETFLDFVRHCQEEVHRLYPDVRFGQMTTFSYFEALGGVKFDEHVQAWAGPHRPLCRPAQGVYGDQSRTGLYYGLAQTMWTIACLPPDTEVYSEVDWGGPWTQMQNSARFAADFQIKANLLLNIKTHSLLIHGEGPDDSFIEGRLIRQLRRSRAQFDGLARHLPDAGRRCGLQFLLSQNMSDPHPLQARGLAGDLADPAGLIGAGLGQPPWPNAIRTLARTGVALTFGDAPVAVLTGGQVGIRLRGEHGVPAFNARLLVVEPG